MGRSRVVAGVLAAVVVLGPAGCGSDEEPTGGRSDHRAAVERMAGEEPSALLSAVRRAVEMTGVRAEVESADAQPYVFLGHGDAWRVETPARLLSADGQLCFDHAFRPVLEDAVATSYGDVAFDPQPWTCTPAEFGLNQLVSYRYPREDPRWRLENLTTDDPAVWSAEVEEVDGEPLLHVRTTGVTADGPLDPARPVHDLWVDGDHQPVRLVTDGTTWELDHPAGLQDDLAVPARAERGSYGYVVGPGQGAAKACQQSGTCSRDGFRGRLTWGDGRGS